MHLERPDGNKCERKGPGVGQDECSCGKPTYAFHNEFDAECEMDIEFPQTQTLSWPHLSPAGGYTLT